MPSEEDRNIWGQPSIPEQRTWPEFRPQAGLREGPGVAMRLLILEVKQRGHEVDR